MISITTAAMRFARFAGVSAVLVLSACNNGFGSGFEGSITLRTTRGSATPVDMVVKAKGDKIRFETPDPTGKMNAAIYVPAKNQIVVVYDAIKSTMAVDLSSPSAAPNTNAATSDVEKTGKKETISGITCEDYVVKDPSGKRTETCIAQGIAFFDLAGLRSPGGGSSWSRQMRDKKMFPLRSVEYDASGKEQSRSEAVSIVKEKLSDSLFEVPDGYREIVRPGH